MLLPEESGKQTSLSKSHTSFFATKKNHVSVKMAFASISLINGILYFAVSKAGGDNVERIFDFQGLGANITMDVISGGSSLCYTMFFYKTLESLSLLPKSVLEGALILLAPLAASSFFTAGMEGTKALGLSSEITLVVACILFILRMVNCADGSAKFPGRLNEMKKEWDIAWTAKNYKELARLIMTGLVSLGYSAASTDAIYNTSIVLLELFGLPKNNTMNYIAFAASILGALGTLPMTLYWTHRGLKQLTFGGRINDEGNNPDPTDRYTALSLPVVSTVTLGIIGSATGTNGKVFGTLGLFSNCVRVGSSTIYAIAAATPGISTLFRGMFKRSTPAEKTDKYHIQHTDEEAAPFLPN